MAELSLNVDRVLAETFVARAEHHPTLSSTNDRAAHCADCPAEELPLLVVADEQTAGRGRGSNRWWTGPGSLAFSLLLDRPEPTPPSPLLGLAAAISVVQAARLHLPDHRLGLHWPNDVMAGDKKLAGVLVEVLANRRPVIGIGLNLNDPAAAAPEELRDRIATLRDLTGHEHGRTAVLIAVLQTFAATLETLATAPEQLAAEADRLCLQRGRDLSLTVGLETVEGRCAGIAGDGALLLDTARGRREVYSGTLGNAAPR